MIIPRITITRLDSERLEHLLDVESVRSQPGTDILDEELKRANIVEPEEIGTDIITMNSTARLMDEQNGTAYELKLVYPDQAGAPGTVSVFAPIGSALLGTSVGQTIKWQVSAGRQLWLRVVGVVNQPESLKQYYR